MGRFYYATSQKATAIVGAAVAAVTAPTDLNLVLAKASRLDLYTVTDDGIQPIAEYSLNGRIATIKCVRINGKDVDYIMATTEHQQFLVLSWDSQKKALTTVATGDLKDRIGRVAERTISLFEPTGKCAAVHLCEGLLKVVPCERGFREKAFNVRMDELQILDIAFLHQQRVPTLAVLYKDMGGKTHLRTYILSLIDRVLSQGPWPSCPVEGGGHMLIPIAGTVGGVIVIGKTQVKWIGGSKGQETCVLNTPPGTSLLAKCYGGIDDSRILLGDQLGNILLLTYTTEAIGGASMLLSGSGSGVTVSKLLIDNLGRCVLANTINYLDGGLVFVGSTAGDHHLIQIRPDRDPVTGKNFTVKQTWTNCGPIVDLCVQDLDRSGQGQVITASGVYEEGSLRVVRNGIGLEEVAAIDLPDIRNLWALKASTLATHHKYLIQSYASCTRVLEASEESLEEAEQTQVPALDLASPSLYCGNTVADLIVQVTATHIRIAKAADMSAVYTWTPPAGARITVATGNSCQVLVALSTKVVLYFIIDASSPSQPLVQKASRSMPHEVACMSVQPLGSSSAPSDSEMDVEGGSGAEPLHASFATIGLWVDVSLHLVNLAATLAASSGIGLLQDVSVEAVGGAVPPRSTLLASLRGVHHAFLGLADGHLYSFRLGSQDNSMAGGAGLPKLLDRKAVQLGRQPIALSSFLANGSAAVFAACDRPTVVHATGPGKLSFSNVNVSDVTAMCVFSTAELPDSLALASESGLLIGQTDELQKLHVKTVSLKEQPKKVAHFKAAGVVAVATEGQRPGLEGTDEMVEAGSISLFDETTFEPLGAGRPFDLDPMELILSMAPVHLGETATAASSAAAGREAGKHGDGTPYLAVGTCYILPGEEEPSKGRLLILAVEGSGPTRRLHLVSMREVRGGVYTLAGLQGGKLVAGINSKMQVYKWDVDSSATGANTKGVGSGSGMAMELEGQGQGGGSAAPTGEMKLTPVCGYTGYTLCLFVETRGDFILVGDLMKSVTLLRYNPSSRTVEVVAQDPGTLWCTAIALHDDTTVLVTDHHHNLLVCERDPGAPTEEERARLAVTGEFHLGEYVNSIAEGSLVMLPQELEDQPQLELAEASEDMEDSLSGSVKGSKRQRPDDALDVASGTASSSSAVVAGGHGSRSGGALAPRPRFILGTVSGAIGVLLTLPNGLYKYLERLQWAMSRAIPPLGGLCHGQYRAFYSDKAAMYAAIAPGDDSAGPKGVIDGDLLEQFLDLPAVLQQKVLDVMNGVKGSGTGASGGGVQVHVPSDVALHPNGAGAAAGPAVLSEVAKTLEDLARLH